MCSADAGGNRISVLLEEITKLGGAGPVEIDPSASGPVYREPRETCSWRIKGSEATLVVMDIENLDVPDLAEKVTPIPCAHSAHCAPAPVADATVGSHMRPTPRFEGD